MKFDDTAKVFGLTQKLHPDLFVGDKIVGLPPRKAVQAKVTSRGVRNAKDEEDRKRARQWAWDHGAEFSRSIYPAGMRGEALARVPTDKLEYRWWCRKRRIEGFVGPLPTEGQAVAAGKCVRDDICLEHFGFFSESKTRKKARICPICHKRDLEPRHQFCGPCGHRRRLNSFNRYKRGRGRHTNDGQSPSGKNEGMAS